MLGLLLMLSSPVGAPPAVAIEAEALTPPATWVTTEDYPPAAIRAGRTGTVAMRLFIDAQGMIAGCTVEQSSGTDLLDQTACGLMKLNGRYRPARAADGRPAPTQKTLRFNWKLPEEGDAAAADPAARIMPPIRPFALVAEMDVSAAGRIENCRVSFGSGLPPEADAMCRAMEGAAVAPRPLGEPQIAGKHVVFRSSITIEDAAAVPPPSAAPPVPAAPSAPEEDVPSRPLHRGRAVSVN